MHVNYISSKEKKSFASELLLVKRNSLKAIFSEFCCSNQIKEKKERENLK